jgi:short-subunit dehydrogenase
MDARKLALVTGASTGIGCELAGVFARNGYDVVIAAEDDDVYAAADKLSGRGATVCAVQIDLRSRRTSKSFTATRPAWAVR